MIMKADMIIWITVNVANTISSTAYAASGIVACGPPTHSQLLTKHAIRQNERHAAVGIT